MKIHFDFPRLFALMVKETKQMMRDPSTFLVAIILPIILLFMFAYAVSLDIKNLPIGIIDDAKSVKSQQLIGKFQGSRFFVTTIFQDKTVAAKAIGAGKIRGIVTIPQDFESRIQNPAIGPLVEIIADGTQPNTARFVANGALALAQSYLMENKGFGIISGVPIIEIVPRYWYNAEIESRRTLIPGAVAIVMTMIGTLLTAMVVAREWERGTMEAMMATPLSVIEILIGKLVPYFVLGQVATLICAAFTTFFFQVPLRGSLFALLVISSAFLIPALGLGLLISAATKNQFMAAQIALFAGFLPATLLSGFVYEISSMPPPLQVISHLFAARYFIDCLRTLFLVGDVWAVFWPNMGFMLLIGLVLFIQSARVTTRTLDGK